ncbi:MAG: cupin domain-containing protein [Candidatus Manganitrophus sp.]|nr:cupin domain-containing protein [Candidatus Manganitrophus sp.]
MVLAPGDSEGDSDNRHRGSDHVLSGTGVAIVNGKRSPLRAGTLLLIERRDKHKIRLNTGRELLRTLNIYVPPAYTKSGRPLPRGRK